jgi:hypothetical protein
MEIQETKKRKLEAETRDEPKTRYEQKTKASPTTLKLRSAILIAVRNYGQ